MARQFEVYAEGLTGLKEFQSLKDDVKFSAVAAINKTATWGRTRAAEEIRDEVNLPARYLNPAGKRLTVSKTATRSDLEGRIRARSRPTSLARFIVGTAVPNKGGVAVEVSPGKARFLKRAFVVTLRSGNTDTTGNLGLAVRLKPGEVLRNKNDVQRLDKGLYLLYGPSVQQVFRARDGSGVADDITPDVVRRLEDEFLRVLEVRRRGR